MTAVGMFAPSCQLLPSRPRRGSGSPRRRGPPGRWASRPRRRSARGRATPARRRSRWEPRKARRHRASSPGSGAPPSPCSVFPIRRAAGRRGSNRSRCRASPSPGLPRRRAGRARVRRTVRRANSARFDRSWVFLDASDARKRIGIDEVFKIQERPGSCTIASQRVRGHADPRSAARGRARW
jgi:hypothetical protein